MNRNLHSPTKLTEFARADVDGDEDSNTYFSQIVNKINSVYNSGYNTMNIVPSSSSSPLPPTGGAAYLPPSIDPPVSSTSSPLIAAATSVQPDDDGGKSDATSTASTTEILDEGMLNLDRSPSGVMDRVRNLMATRNDVRRAFLACE